MLRPWFLRPKPKIILPARPQGDSEFGRGVLPDDFVADLPWLSEFDPSNPVDQARLGVILRVSSVKGQSFVVCLATDAQRKALVTFASFPTSDEVSEAVAERYGGGVFNVWSSKPRPQLIRTFHVQGSPKGPSAKSRQQDRIAELIVEIKAALMESAMDHLQDHPEVFNELALGVLCKELGIPIPNMPDFEEEMVREAQRDPAWREAEAQRILDAREAEAERIAESQKLDDLLNYVKRVNRIAELMGFERNAQPGAGAGWDELMKVLLADGGLTDILEAFKNVRHPRNPAQAPQASADGEPPHAEEQPKAENGAHSSPVAEHLPPDTPPQSAVPQEPRVRESPGGWTGPRRFDIGVPAEELGLLGLRGDTTFVDWPLV